MDDYTLIDSLRFYDGQLAHYKNFIRFYENGNFSSFHFYEKDTLIGENTFNPKNGIIGVYAIKGNELILIKEFIASPNIGGYYRKSKAISKGDTLHLIKKLTSGYKGFHHIYLKKEIPKKYLDWESDW